MLRPSDHDPGPCPVDDAPHTTCVSADYQGRRDRVVVVTSSQAAQCVVVPVASVPQTTPPTDERTTFTTAEYRGRTPKRARR